MKDVLITIPVVREIVVDGEVEERLCEIVLSAKVDDTFDFQGVITSIKSPRIREVVFANTTMKGEEK